MSVRLAVWLSHLAILLLALLFVATVFGHAYAGTNAGVFVDLPGSHWLGFEYRGTPGFFFDVT